MTEKTNTIMPNKQTQFKQAPLPFTGQKRMFLKPFKQVLNDNIQGAGEGWTIIDVFGGSGLLAHTAKREKPQARVIYNDFDGYAERLTHIKETNQLRQILFAHLDGKAPKNKRLSPAMKQEIIDKINAFQGVKDLKCLSYWLLFSGNQVASLADLYKEDFWHRVRQSDYPEATGYLDGLEVVCESFHQLLPKFKDKEKVLLLLDPPYLCTKQESYKQAHYFDLIDFLHLIDLTKPPYLFFSSTKSEFIRFIHYMVANKKENWQSFEGAKRIVVHATMNHSSKYEDNLVYKF